MKSLQQHAAQTRDMVPHLDTLYRLAHTAGGHIVEFGVRSGVSTWVLLDALHPDGVLHSWDIVNTWDRLPQRVKADSRWRFHMEDSAKAEVKGTPEMLFIDSSHEYHQTLRELRWADSYAVPLVVLHDWNLPDIRDAVHGFTHRFPYRIEGIEPSQWGLVWLVRT